ncbi:MAG: hypothetical protein F6K11_11235 [Leptolyngbya sp. SIO3F4]|nr:hypothetical protein [Leptolyngbya sp. SIO3F4]
MRFWALGIIYGYIALTLFNWLTGSHWLAGFSLPLSILGGLGLAIASHTTTSLLPSTHATSTPGNTSSQTETIEDISQGPTTPPSHSAAKSTQESSISFTINKNIRPS